MCPLYACDERMQSHSDGPGAVRAVSKVSQTSQLIQIKRLFFHLNELHFPCGSMFTMVVVTRSNPFQLILPQKPLKDLYILLRKLDT